MDSVKYPGHLNPFGDDDIIEDPNDYPDHLDPFGEADAQRESNICSMIAIKSDDDYDDSLNPFGDEPDDIDKKSNSTEIQKEAIASKISDEGNPFAEMADVVPSQHESRDEHVSITNDETTAANKISPPSQPQSLESLEPPKPLPRTKSLLKKELAMKRGQEGQHSNQMPSLAQEDPNHQLNDAITNTSSTINNGVGSLQKKKNKRVAPPVPVNFKRQVSGSLDDIEKELDGIGDQLATIEEESNQCQKALTVPEATQQADFHTTKSKLINLIKRKNSIIRRQKELMYMKRQLKLDQIHSDIEFELRMIGNKQLSTRTSEDKAKEKELLKQLVEIIEEKSDIVENSNKDTSCDSRDIEEAFKRLNLEEHLPGGNLLKSTTGSSPSPSPQSLPPASGISPKHVNCDKLNLNKLSKIATLLPKSNTLKSTMKIKRKRFFKKNHDSQTPIEKTET